MREQEAVERVRHELPSFDATPIRSEVCAWTESADDLFVVDRVGDVVVGCGDSGQGFKFLPMFGQVLADLVGGTPRGRTRSPLGRRRFTRPERDVGRRWLGWGRPTSPPAGGRP